MGERWYVTYHFFILRLQWNFQIMRRWIGNVSHLREKRNNEIVTWEGVYTTKRRGDFRTGASSLRFTLALYFFFFYMIQPKNVMLRRLTPAPVQPSCRTGAKFRSGAKSRHGIKNKGTTTPSLWNRPPSGLGRVAQAYYSSEIPRGLLKHLGLRMTKEQPRFLQHYKKVSKYSLFSNCP